MINLRAEIMEGPQFLNTGKLGRPEILNNVIKYSAPVL